VHASTVLRQIRRVEIKRDDPLIDEALTHLGAMISAAQTTGRTQEDTSAEPHDEKAALSEGTLRLTAKDILLELSEVGTVLAFAKDMEKAVVVRDLPNGRVQRGTAVDRSIAQAMALKDWIRCKTPGRVSRYQITAEGRAELAQLLDCEAHFGCGVNESPQRDQARQLTALAARPLRRARFSTQESPIAMLARRKGKGGQPFLTQDLVAASERLREDFELSQIGPSVAQNWDHFLTAGISSEGQQICHSSASGAQQRLQTALQLLGEGLADVALRCCCYQDGMESVEKRLGWPARSGKVVLRIALIKLRDHYQAQGDLDHSLIG